jgi:hypothetical protein
LPQTVQRGMTRRQEFCFSTTVRYDRDTSPKRQF